MRHVFLIVLILFTLPPLTTFSEEVAHSGHINQEEKTYAELKNLLHNGAFNKKLFLELQKYAPTSAEKMAYLRQTMVLDPSNMTIRNSIHDLKQTLHSDTSPHKLNQKSSLIDIISLKSYLPFYVIDFLSILSGVFFTLLIIFRKNNFILVILLGIIPAYILLDKILICYTRDGSLRVINSLSDIHKTEGISLSEMKTYASQDTQSQITALIKPAQEVDILDNNPQAGSWVKVKFENGRSGWYIYEPEELFIIRH